MTLIEGILEAKGENDSNLHLYGDMEDVYKALSSLRAAVERGSATAKRSNDDAYANALLHLADAHAKLRQADDQEREALEQAKARLEAKMRPLKNARYQRDCIERSISRMRAGAPDTDVDGLLSLDEARALVGTDVYASSSGQPAASELHAAMLGRLAVELRERQRLRAEVAPALSKKRKLAELARERQQQDSTLCSLLDGFLSSASALRSQLPPLSAAAAPEPPPALASRLPPPLHTLWRATAAFLEARGVAAVLSIEGDEEDAQPAGAGLTDAHPLYVVLAHSTKPAVRLTFHWIAAARLIAVAASPAKTATQLRTLVADDGGRTVPSDVAKLLLQAEALESDTFLKSLEPKVPYKWAQWLGGLGPPLDSLEPVRPVESTLRLLVDVLHK